MRGLSDVPLIDSSSHPIYGASRSSSPILSSDERADINRESDADALHTLPQRAAGSSMRSSPSASKHHSLRVVANLRDFCRMYLVGKQPIDITADLPGVHRKRSSSSMPQASQRYSVGPNSEGDKPLQRRSSEGIGGMCDWFPSFLSIRWYIEITLQFFKGFDIVFSSTVKLGDKDRRYHLVFYLFLVTSLVTNLTGLFVYVKATESQSCNIIIPTGDGDCCQCVCDVQKAWCATFPNSFANITGPNATTPSSLVPLEVYGNYFSGTNSVQNTAASRKLGVATVYTISLLFTMVELGVARLRGNWYMLLCVCTAMVLQGLRNLYLHFPVFDWDTFGDTADAYDFVVLVADIASIVFAWLAAWMLKSLRPAFLTTQFMHFGKLTRHQETLRNYNVMFAATLLDWQTSTLLYFQLAVLASNNQNMLSCIVLMYISDVLSNYVGYTYIRFEKYWHTVFALLSKAILAVSWLAMSAYVVWCYDLFRARALYLRATLVASQYLGVDAADAQAYLLGDCGISPIVSGSGDVIVMFSSLAVAFFVRVIAIFYAALLTADFGNTVIASLFFDVVGIQQKKGLPLPDAAVDTLDIRKANRNVA